MSLNPSKIVILRHGEKPGDPASDEKDGDIHLSVRGQCRAAALAPALPSIFGKPDFILATQESKGSNRPIETITPLAKSLGVDIDSKHADDDYAKVADEVLNHPKYTGKLVVICWHHGKIPDLVKAMGVIPPVSPWPPTVFDRYWVIAADANGKPQAQNQSQRLLFGDDPG
jgi:phosphohistidine phosphatase SixA